MEIQEMKTVIFFIVMTSAATEDVKKNLTCTDGGSITLPDPVVESGFLLHGVLNIAMVNKRESQILEERFRYRLHWDSNTGLFTFTRLQTGDSGIYTIDSKRRGDSTSYRLTVYAAPRPGVNRSRVSADSCTLVCFVEKAHETTLYWIKGEEILNQTSTGPSLPLTVDKQDFSSSYRCVAANPAADEKTLPVNAKTFCSEENNTDKPSENNRQFGTLLIAIVVILIVIAIIIIIGIYFERQKRKRDRRSQDSVAGKREVVYTDSIADERNGQGRKLTTVYDKLEVH
ncbi:SLAM family member 7-like isoform X2 [Centroberyx affinis]|uniref:SLAM family member 7-like isoform X2 n=1 Tax=Centroberyx affinis TaxID=166261 RepID=UPI003A5C75BA